MVPIWPIGAPLDAAGSRWRFELLGPVRAWREENEIALGWPRQKAVLAALLLRRGETVPVNSIIDAVWGSDAPSTATAVVHSHVARLRKVLEPDRAPRSPGQLLRSAASGYALCLASCQVDLRVAEQHLARAQLARANGDAGAALRALDAALGLWRGQALASVPGPLAEIHRARLTELRLTAMEDRFEALLTSGRPTALTGELAALVAEYPFRERLRAAQMAALYLAGRQAEALAAYADIRRLLADELGIEPTRELRQLHDDILNQRHLDTAYPAGCRRPKLETRWSHARRQIQPAKRGRCS